MKDLQVIEKKMPVIEINFNELKNELLEKTEHYKSLVVTEETIPECKESQKSLAGLRIKLDNERKEVKKIFSAPIAEFEKQVKELIEIVLEAEKPIKAGLNFYEEKRVKEKFETINNIRNEVLEGINSDYASKIETPLNFTNKTVTEKAIKDYFETQKINMLVKIEEDEKRKEAIEKDVDEINKEYELLTPITSLKYENYPDIDIFELFNMIKNDARNQKKIEDEAKERAIQSERKRAEDEAKENIIVETVKEEIEEVKTETFEDIIPKQDDKIVKVKKLNVIVTKENWIDLIAFFKKNEIEFEVL